MVAAQGPEQRRLVITGADGFIGQPLAAALEADGATVVRVVRSLRTGGAGGERVAVGDLAAQPDLGRVLAGADTVIHLAAVTHSADTTDTAAMARYRAVNVDASVHLARAAHAAGVARFVFLSSIKVNGERTPYPARAEQRFSPVSAPRPEDNYGRSKLEAEIALRAICNDTHMQLTVLRPPLVYGPGNKGNLLRLLHWVAARRPLPFAAVDNSRSLLFVDNLIDAIKLAAAPGHDGGLYTLADVDLSTPALIRAMATALGVRPRLLRMPVRALGAICAATGRRAEWQRLSGSLLVDSSAIRTRLGWQPAIAPTAAMGATAAWYSSTS